MALSIIGTTLISIGSAAIFSGLLGIFRFPDFFTKAQAAGIIESFGVPLCLIGGACLAPSSAFSAKSVLAFLFIIILSPLSTHILTRAAFSSKTNRKNLSVEKK